MKRRAPWSITLIAATVAVLVTNSDSIVEAQDRQRQPSHTATTGIITPGPDQVLSVTVNGGSGDNAIAVRFRRTRYVKTSCAEDGVCRYVVESQTTSNPLSAPNQSSKLDVMGSQIGPDAAVSIEVMSSSPNAGATVQVSDALTGRVDSVLIALLLP